MKKKALAALLAALMLFALTSCSVSSTSTSTTTVTTSKTDENGNTMTQTVTNEIGFSAGTDGVSVTNQTTTTTTGNDTGVTSEELKTALAQTFSAGAEGVSAEGDKILFAYDDPEVFSYGAIIIVSDDGQSLMGREGEISYAGEQWKLVDVEMEDEMPFVLSDTEDDDELSFVMSFQDGDSAARRRILCKRYSTKSRMAL